MSRGLMRAAAFVLGLGLTASAGLLPRAAWADVTHVVQRGHTIEAIAHRYRVTVKAILDANHLKDAKHLKPGQVLVIPGVDGKGHGPGGRERDKRDTVERTERSEHKGDRSERLDHGHVPAHPATASVAAREPPPEPRGRGDADTVYAGRLGEEFRIRVKDGHGHIPPSALKAFERMMRQGNATHTVDPRLVALVGIVSSHFGGKPLEIVSGYRAYTPTQYTAHSNHNLGRALDFRVRGVSNETVRDFCRTLRSAGCGYYPNSTFVHLDVRDTKAYWVDWSHPGEPPKYDRPGVAADEGASDVPDENPPPASGSSETRGDSLQLLPAPP
jgi:uncharacterized protein YcbK (DUF882 family)